MRNLCIDIIYQLEAYPFRFEHKNKMVQLVLIWILNSYKDIRVGSTLPRNIVSAVSNYSVKRRRIALQTAADPIFAMLKIAGQPIEESIILTTA